MKIMLIWLQMFFLSTNLLGYNYTKDLLLYGNDTLVVSQIPIEVEFKKIIETRSTSINQCAHMKCDVGYNIWTLRNDSLFLTQALDCCGQEHLNENFKSLLCEVYNGDEVFANWVNHSIYNQFGELIFTISDHLIYEFDRDFIIEKGILKEIKSYDNRGSRKSIFFERRDTLNKFLNQLINWEIIEKNQCELDKTIVVNFKVNKDRKAEDIKVLRSKNERCNSEIKRIIKEIPECNLFLKKGKPIELRWNFPIKLNQLNAFNIKK